MIRKQLDGLLVKVKILIRFLDGFRGKSHAPHPEDMYKMSIYRDIQEDNIYDKNSKSYAWYGRSRDNIKLEHL